MDQSELQKKSKEFFFKLCSFGDEFRQGQHPSVVHLLLDSKYWREEFAKFCLLDEVIENLPQRAMEGFQAAQGQFENNNIVESIMMIDKLQSFSHGIAAVELVRASLGQLNTVIALENGLQPLSLWKFNQTLMGPLANFELRLWKWIKTHLVRSVVEETLKSVQSDRHGLSYNWLQHFDAAAPEMDAHETVRPPSASYPTEEYDENDDEEESPPTRRANDLPH